MGEPVQSQLKARARLIGDGVEKPANARAIMDAAAMFGVTCMFRDRRGLAGSWSVERGGVLPVISTEQFLQEMLPLVAVENAPDASPIFGAPLPPGIPAIVVGGEKRGIAGDALRAASRCVEIPMSGRGIDTLNVASAAAVALFYLLGSQRHGMRKRSNPESHRPALLLLGPTDHVEAGSALRSAAAFGWRTVGLDDRNGVWFGVPRHVAAEGRAASRAHKNLTRLVSMRADGPIGFRKVVVAGATVDGPPLHRVDLAGGRNMVVVVPDEENDHLPAWKELGPNVALARVDLPTKRSPYRYRLIASIILAEVSRQLGAGPAVGRRVPTEKELTYESALETLAGVSGDSITPAELRLY